MDMAFEEVCAVLEEAGVNNPKQMTVFEFNQRKIFYEKKWSNNKK